MHVSSKITTPRTNNEPNYRAAPPNQNPCYYGDDKIKTKCGIKYWNASMNVKCRLLHFDKILGKSIK